MSTHNMKSFKEQLKMYIQDRGQVSYADMVIFAAEEGYRLSNLERRMRELCNEYPIKPVIKKSKRGTNYIAGWELEEIEPTHVLTNLGNGTEYIRIDDLVSRINAMPAFAPKKETKVNQNNLGI